MSSPCARPARHPDRAPERNDGVAARSTYVPRWRRLGAGLALAAVVLTGCSGGKLDLPGVSQADQDAANSVADQLANGLTRNDLTAVPVSGVTAAEADRQLDVETAGMEPASLAASVKATDVDSSAATVTLALTWTFPGVAQTWTYESKARLASVDGTWSAAWQPSIVHPDLSGTARLVGTRTQGKRADILGAGTSKLMTARKVVRVGLDKTLVPAAKQPAAARALAKLVGIDVGAFQESVADAGAQAFVEAITYRADAKDKPSYSRLTKIPGARSLDGTAVLAPTREFARPILGTVGAASKEVIDDSKGAVGSGDVVGLSGLEQRYDEQLRGTPGVTVTVVGSAASASPSPGSSASPSPTPTLSGSPSSSATPSAALFAVAATAGKPVTLTLDPTLQRRAESILADVKPDAAIVAIRPSTGEVLAAASGPGADGRSSATVGQYAPGSTFKVASSLALLRAGLTPTTKVTCPKTVTADGRVFKNYDDYPASQRGTITLRTALAQSCNTAFIGQRTKLGADDLTTAAASLGLGTDYDVGFPSYFGSVPKVTGGTTKAASMIGQAQVQASPLAMAAVAASVSAGKTVIPHLVDGQQATSKAKPLTAAEAKQLQSMMGAVVSEGPGAFLQSVEPPTVIAKTGTAEYGKATPPRTHAWMIAAQGDLAVAVFVGDGDSGSGTAGPLLKSFLQG